MALTGNKRRLGESPSTPAKRTKSNEPSFNHERKEEQHGIVDRRFYPPEMANERCAMYNANEIQRPIEALLEAQQETETQREAIPVQNAVVHWFKKDLRLSDNKALSFASDKAREKGVPLICLYIVSPQDFEAHMTSPARVDFILRSLEVVKEDLAELDIPLYIETVDQRKKVPSRILELCSEWKASHLYTNIEYEVDELRREARLIRRGLQEGIAVDALPDTCVVAPGELSSGTGSQYSVYSPWFRAWTSYLHTHPHHLKLYNVPAKNPTGARDRFSHLFDTAIPESPGKKRLSAEEKERFASLWPAGEHEAHERVSKFISEKIKRYKDTRNFPAANSTAVISVHLAAGTLSARTAVSVASAANSSKKLDGGNPGIAGWISEIAWRDFYKHVLAHWPFVCMNKPFKPEYTDIAWEYNNDLFQKWCDGQTGYPFIDAAMRQLNYMGYMHNRARMGVASFLAKDLLEDWRRGERYFMEHLIDGDFASNNGGWGFSASTGA